MPLIIEIKVIPKSSIEKVAEKNGILRVYVKSAPDKGKANRDVIEVIAREYKVRKSDVRILRGETSRNKVVEVNTDG